MRSRPFLDLMRSFKWFPGLFWTFNLVLAKSHVSSSSFCIFVTFKNRKNSDDVRKAVKGGGIKFAKQAKTYCLGLNKRRYNKTGVRYLEIVKNPEKKDFHAVN